MIESFEVVITPFDRNRKITIYLPKDYYQNDNKRYPVLYMHDGQNLFKDEDAAYGMSWGISEYLNQSDIELIVVGIDCNRDGYKRLDEYAPWKYPSKEKIFPNQNGEIGGEGKEYIDYIVNELKPMIDKKYRTNPIETSMAGSSMGGLISTYAAGAYPTIFKRIAAVSSSYWFNQNEIEKFLDEVDLSGIEKFYLDIGTKETNNEEDNLSSIKSNKTIYNILRNKVSDCKFDIVEDAVHNEKAWRERLPNILSFLYN